MPRTRAKAAKQVKITPPIRERLTALFEKHPDYTDYLERVIQAEEEDRGLVRYGWEWSDVDVPSHVIKALFTAGVLTVKYKSSKHTRWRVLDRAGAKKFLGAWKSVAAPEPPETAPDDTPDGESSGSDMAPEETTAQNTVLEALPPGFFDTVVGFDDVKFLVGKILMSDEPNHVLLSGPPASAKTLFLDAIATLQGSAFALGGTSSKAGLTKLLMEVRPAYLMVDEIDKMDNEDFSALLSLMETGRVCQTKGNSGGRKEIWLKTRVFAACNDWKKVPAEVLSRFMECHVRAYTPDEFTDVAMILARRRGIDEELGRYIAEQILERDHYDIRDVMQILKLKPGNREDIDTLLSILKKYQRPT